MRNRSGHDPTTHETVSHPSYRRGRSSRFEDGLYMEKHSFRISTISQKHISCETSFKTPSATHPPAPLAIPFIYIAGTILQLQITMEFCRSRMHEKHLKPNLQCGTNPRMIRLHTRPSRTRRTAEVAHRRSRTDFVWKNIGFRASALSKTHFVRGFLQNSIGNSSTSTTYNPIYIAGTILQLQIIMEFSVDSTCTKNT